MICRHWLKKIAAFHQGRLDPQARERLLQHLAKCPSCRQTLAWEKILDQGFRLEPKVSAAPGFNQAVWRKLKAAAPAVSRPWYFSKGLAVAGASAVVLLVLLSVSPRLYHLPANSGPKPADQAWRPTVFQEKPNFSKHSRPAARQMAAQVQSASEPDRHEAKQIKPTPGPTVLVQVAEKARVGLEPAQPRAAAAVSSQAEFPQTKAQAPLLAARLPAGYLAGTGQTVSADDTVKRSASSQKNPGAAATSSEVALAGTPANAAEEIRLFNNKIHASRGEHARLEFTLACPGYVQVKIYSRDGRLVKVLVAACLPAGRHTLEWDGSSESGHKAASGIYLLVFKGDQGEYKFKIAVIK